VKAADIKVPAQLVAWLAERGLYLGGHTGRADSRVHIVKLRRGTELVATGSGLDWATALLAATLTLEEKES